tara:strand:+ start:63 stop:461 length:399 start_codon:yes stop_codon:yes gene_type:complete
MADRTSRSYKDITLDFLPNPVTGDLSVIKNERAIIRSVRNLVQTKLKERFYNPDLGSDIYETLFGFCDVATGSVLARDIKSLLAMWEPRIDNIIVKADPRPDQNEFEVTISFEVVGQPQALSSFSFILEATR